MANTLEGVKWDKTDQRNNFSSQFVYAPLNQSENPAPVKAAYIQAPAVTVGDVFTPKASGIGSTYVGTATPVKTQKLHTDYGAQNEAAMNALSADAFKGDPLLQFDANTNKPGTFDTTVKGVGAGTLEAGEDIIRTPGYLKTAALQYASDTMGEGNIDFDALMYGDADTYRKAVEEAEYNKNVKSKELAQKAQQAFEDTQKIKLYKDDGKIRQFIDQTKKDMQSLESAPGRFVAQMGYSAGRMLPSMAIGAATGGLGSVAGLAAAEGLAQAASMATLFSSVYSRSLEDTVKSGVDLSTATKKALGDAAIETGTEILFGGIPGLGDGVVDKALRQVGGALSKVPAASRLMETLGQSAAGKLLSGTTAGLATVMSKKVGAKTLGEFISDVIGEGIEEMISEVLTPFLDRATIDPNAKNADFSQVMLAGLSGSLLSVVMGGMAAMTQSRALNKNAEAMKDTISILNNLRDEGIWSADVLNRLGTSLDGFYSTELALSAAQAYRKAAFDGVERLQYVPGVTTAEDIAEYATKLATRAATQADFLKDLGFSGIDPATFQTESGKIDAEGLVSAVYQSQRAAQVAMLEGEGLSTQEAIAAVNANDLRTPTQREADKKAAEAAIKASKEKNAKPRKSAADRAKEKAQQAITLQPVAAQQSEQQSTPQEEQVQLPMTEAAPVETQAPVQTQQAPSVLDETFAPAQQTQTEQPAQQQTTAQTQAQQQTRAPKGKNQFYDIVDEGPGWPAYFKKVQTEAKRLGSLKVGEQATIQVGDLNLTIRRKTTKGKVKHQFEVVAVNQPAAKSAIEEAFAPAAQTQQPAAQVATQQEAAQQTEQRSADRVYIPSDNRILKNGLMRAENAALRAKLKSSPELNVENYKNGEKVYVPVSYTALSTPEPGAASGTPFTAHSLIELTAKTNKKGEKSFKFSKGSNTQLVSGAAVRIADIIDKLLAGATPAEVRSDVEAALEELQKIANRGDVRHNPNAKKLIEQARSELVVVKTMLDKGTARDVIGNLAEVTKAVNKAAEILSKKNKTWDQSAEAKTNRARNKGQQKASPASRISNLMGANNHALSKEYYAALDALGTSLDEAPVDALMKVRTASGHTMWFVVEPGKDRGGRPNTRVIMVIDPDGQTVDSYSKAELEKYRLNAPNVTRSSTDAVPVDQAVSETVEEPTVIESDEEMDVPDFIPEEPLPAEIEEAENAVDSAVEQEVASEEEVAEEVAEQEADEAIAQATEEAGVQAAEETIAEAAEEAVAPEPDANDYLAAAVIDNIEDAVMALDEEGLMTEQMEATFQLIERLTKVVEEHRVAARDAGLDTSAFVDVLNGIDQMLADIANGDVTEYRDIRSAYKDLVDSLKQAVEGVNNGREERGRASGFNPKRTDEGRSQTEQSRNSVQWNANDRRGRAEDRGSRGEKASEIDEYLAGTSIERNSETDNATVKAVTARELAGGYSRYSDTQVLYELPVSQIRDANAQAALSDYSVRTGAELHMYSGVGLITDYADGRTGLAYGATVRDLKNGTMRVIFPYLRRGSTQLQFDIQTTEHELAHGAILPAVKESDTAKYKESRERVFRIYESAADSAGISTETLMDLIGWYDVVTGGGYGKALCVDEILCDAAARIDELSNSLQAVGIPEAVLSEYPKLLAALRESFLVEFPWMRSVLSALDNLLFEVNERARVSTSDLDSLLFDLDAAWAAAGINGNKVGRLQQNILSDPRNTPKYTNLQRQRILEGMGQYTVLSNKKLEAAARKWLDTYETENGLDMEPAYTAYMHDILSKELISDEEVVRGEILLATLAQEGENASDETLAKWERLVAALDVRARALGRAVQAFSLLKNLSPKGRVFYIKQAIEQYKAELSHRGAKLSKALEDLDVEKDETLQRLFAELEATETPQLGESTRTAEEIEDEIIRYIADKIPATITSRAVAWRYLSMLGNPPTHLRNVVSNIAMALTAMSKDALKAGVEDIASVFSPKVREGRTVSLVHRPDAAMRAFAKQDFETMKDVLLNNGRKMGVRNRIEELVNPYGKSAPAKLLNKLSQINNKLLGDIEDGSFIQLHYRRALANYLAARSIDPSIFQSNDPRVMEILANARRHAATEAWRDTFHEASKVADALNKLEKSSPMMQLLIGGVMPFKQTPINILKQGVRYTGGGLVAGAWQLATKVNSGEVTIDQAIDNLTAGLTGTGAVLLGFLLGGMGLAKGGIGDSDKEKYYNQMLGEQEYSVRFGDKTYTLDWLSPMAIPFFAGVELSDVINNDERFNMTPTEAIDLILNIADPVTNLSMLQGISSALQSYENRGPLEVAASAAEGYISQFLPTMGGQLARTIDPTRRVTYASKDTSFAGGQRMEKFINRLKNKLPGVSTQNEPYIDMWGRTEERTSNPVLRAVEQFASPGYVKQENRTAVDDMLTQLYDQTGDAKVLPSQANSSFTVNKQRYYMNPEDYTTYKQVDGRLAYRGLEEAMKNPYFSRMKDSDKVKVVNNIYSFSDAVAKEWYCGKNGIALDKGSSVSKVEAALEANLSIGDYFIFKALMGHFSKTSEKKELAEELGLTEAQYEVLK